jgi:hypothetical protein
MEHLFCPEHGGALLVALSSFSWTWLYVRWPKKYRVLQERVAYGEVEHRIHGPYRSYIWASLVAICIVLGREYDSATVQERK